MSTTRMTLLGLTLAALLLPACSRSRDVASYESSLVRPTSIAVVDSLTGETAWSMDIPAEHRLVLDFEGEDAAEAFRFEMTPAKTMEWKLLGPGHKKNMFGSYSGEVVESDVVELGGRPVFVQVSYRAPEE